LGGNERIDTADPIGICIHGAGSSSGVNKILRGTLRL
jgi:hypothetical protein